jgi:hypothetical protein
MGWIQTTAKNFNADPHELIAIEVRESAGHRGDVLTLVSGSIVNRTHRTVYATAAEATASYEDPRHRDARTDAAKIRNTLLHSCAPDVAHS